MPTKQQIQALKKRALSGYDGFRCCRGNGLRQRLAALQLIQMAEEWIDSRPAEGLVMLPKGSPVETAIVNVRQTPTEFLIAPGFTTDWLDMTDAIPQTRPLFEPTKKFVNRLVDTMNKESSNCYNCVIRAAWKQSKRRKRGRLVVRGVDKGPIQVRVPHA